MKRSIALALAALLVAVSAYADDDAFADKPERAKQHIASGFVCPVTIGPFERDAVGVRNPEAGSDYCAYSAQGGVYGTIVLSPLHGDFDPKMLMVPDFVVQEGTGGHMTEETTLFLGPQKSLSTYSRTYETAKIESLHYRVEFACAAVGGWAVEAIVEYAAPRDTETRDAFLNAVFNAALNELAAPAKE